MKQIKGILTIIFLSFLNLNSQSHPGKWDVDKTRWSTLMLAVYNGEHDAVKELIANGVAINYSTKSHHKLNAIEVAIRNDNESAFQLLMATDSIESLRDYLRLASKENSTLITKQVLLNGGIVNDTLENGYSMLMFAAAFGSVSVLETLLENGADIYQTRKSDGWTALHLSTHKGSLEKVQLLLKHGANKDYKDKYEKKAFDLVDAIYERYDVIKQTKKELKKVLE